MRNFIFAALLVFGFAGLAYADEITNVPSDQVVGTSGKAYRVRAVDLTCAGAQCCGYIRNGTTVSAAIKLVVCGAASTTTRTDYSSFNAGKGIAVTSGLYFDASVTGTTTNAAVIYGAFP